MCNKTTITTTTEATISGKHSLLYSLKSMKKHFFKLIRLKRIIVCPEMSHISERNLYKHRKGDFSRFNYSNLMRLSNPTVSEYYRNQFGFLFLA